MMSLKRPRLFAGPFLICEGLVIADAVVIAAPPIRTPRNEGLSAQPPTIIVGVVIGTVGPDPNTVPKYPMTVMEPVKVVVMIAVALRKAPVIKPITVAMVVALDKSTTVSMIVTAITMLDKSATITAFCEPGSTHSRADKITAAHSGRMATAVTARHCTGMATTATTARAMATAAMHLAAA